MRHVASIAILLVGIVGTAACLAEEAIPDYYAEAGLHPQRDYLDQHPDEHIDPFTGALQLQHVDLVIPGNGGLDIKIQRAYVSAQTTLGLRTPTGVGWTMHFGRVIKTKDSFVCSRLFIESVLDNPVLELPDGSRQILYDAKTVNSSGPLFLTTARWKADCSTDGSHLIITSPEGLEYTMNYYGRLGSGSSTEHSWYATRIEDRNNNFISISYKTSSFGYTLIDSVSTSDGRSVSYTYSNESTNAVRLSQVSANGHSWSYYYQSLSGIAGDYDQLVQVSRPDGSSWRYDYNSYGGFAGSASLRQVTYPMGGSISYSYGYVAFDPGNSAYRTTVITQKSVNSGGSWSFSYSPSGSYDTTTVYAPNGTYTYKHFGYNAASPGTYWKVGLLLEKSISGSASESHTYQWDGQLISYENNLRPQRFVTQYDTASYAPILTRKTITRDGSSYSTAFSNHDQYGNPHNISESGNASRTTSLTYYINLSKWIIKQVEDESISGAGTIARTFDSNGNLTREDRFGVATSYGRTSSGDISSKTNARGYTISYSGHYRGIPTNENHPAGVTISRSVNPTGTIASERNGRGYTKTFTYDGLNRLTGINMPTGSSIGISWGSASKSLTRGSYQENTTFDGFERPTKISKGGIAKTMDYDALGRKTFESYPGSSSGLSFSYDAIGRVTGISHPGGSKSMNYSGNSVSVSNERGYSTTYGYRSYGNPDYRELVSISAPGVTTSISRNGLGQITAVTQGGVSRSYGYGSGNFLTSSTDPETGTTTYGRDGVGNMTSRSVGASGTTYFTYDGLDRMTNINYPSSGSVSQSFDENNNITSISNSGSQVTYSYDANDNLTREAINIGGRSFTIGHSYNGLDGRSSTTYPSGRTVNFSPDVLGRPTQASPYVTNATYHPNGQLATMNYANGIYTSISVNSRQLPSSISASGILGLSYNYDGAGNITSIGDGLAAADRSLSYDGLDRLTSAGGSWGGGTLNYDDMGNLTSQTLGPLSLFYNYDGSRRLSSVSGTHQYSFSYDAYGNVTNNGKDRFTYDDAGNMRCAKCTTPAQIDYSYDGKNTRVLTRKNGADTYQVYSKNGELLGEYGPVGGGSKEYIHLGGKLVAERAGY